MFDGLLLSPHNETILDLLFDLATWHAFAKLRLHIDDTLSFFDVVTACLSYTVQKFQQTTCSFYLTTELPQESSARVRKQANAIAKNPQLSKRDDVNHLNTGLKIKHLNLLTYKYHALANYPDMIQ